PREVLRGHAGTCVNTSICYASLAEAAGLESFIVLIPGHAFAGVILPKSRELVYVETTGCGGGTPETSIDFERAPEAASDEMKKAADAKLFMVVNMAEVRGKGIVPPELPAPPRDAVAEWGVVIPDQPLKKAAPPPPATTGPSATMEFVKKEQVTRGN